MRVTFLSKYEYLLEDIEIRNLKHQKYCVFDLEGTGINFKTEHITQFGAIILENGEVKQQFSSYVKSPKSVPPNVEKLTGISDTLIKDAPSFPEVYEQFLDFCEGCVLVTQAGYEYDVPLLENHCRDYGNPLFNNPIIDTKALFANIHRDYNDVISTNFLINYYQVNQKDAPRHNALGDCVLISRIFKGILDEYEQKNIDDFCILDGLTLKRFIIPGMYIDQN